MGQYWKVCNLDKREYIDPHKLGSGLKLWEIIANHPGPATALVILCAAMPERRGGGDFSMDNDVAKRTVGRWAGDRIALIGDYAEKNDLKDFDVTEIKYDLEDIDGLELDEVNFANEQVAVDMLLEAGCPSIGSIRKHGGGLSERLAKLVPNRKRWASLRKIAGARTQVWRDISDDVAAIIEKVLNGKYEGDGFRHFKENGAAT